MVILACSSILFSSCKKVIQLDLKQSDKKIVIEGGINDASPINTITLTKNINFNKSNVFPNVTGAIVKISDNAGNSETLTETSAGVYQTFSMQGVQGRTYFLSVEAEGKTYSAQSTMPYKVNFDTLSVTKEAGFLGGDSLYAISPFYQDPAGIKNYYRFVRYINNKRDKGSVSENDFFYDGLYRSKPLDDEGFELKSTDLKSKDTLTIEMQCVDKAVNLYFVSKLQTASGASGAPANPVSNIVGGALGYFSAYTKQIRKVKIQ
jgi:hypothetical protein